MTLGCQELTQRGAPENPALIDYSPVNGRGGACGLVISLVEIKASLALGAGAPKGPPPSQRVRRTEHSGVATRLQRQIALQRQI